MLGCHGPQEGVGSSTDASGQGEGHYTPEEHCPTGDQVSGGQELRRGLQATQTQRSLESSGAIITAQWGWA